MANELQGIFTQLAKGVSSIATDTANDEYKKSIQIKRSLEHLELNRKLENDITAKADKDYQREQTKKNNINTDAKVFVSNIIDQYKSEVSKKNITNDELIALNNEYNTKLDEYDFTGANIYLETGQKIMQSLSNSVSNSNTILNTLNNLENEREKLYQKNMRSGNYSIPSKDSYWNIIDNTKSLISNQKSSLNEQQSTSIVNFLDNLTKQEYVRETLAMYDVDPKLGGLQLKEDQMVGGEQQVMQEVARLYQNGLIDDAYTKIKNLSNQKSQDRSNIASMTNNNIKEINKANANLLTSEINTIKTYTNFKNMEGKDLFFNNIDNVSIDEGLGVETNWALTSKAYGRDLNQGVIMFTKTKSGDMYDEAKEIADDIQILDKNAKMFYLSGYLTKVEKDDKEEFYWNTKTPIPYKKWDSKEKKYKYIDYSDFSVNSQGWDDARVQRSIEKLAEKFNPDIEYVSQGEAETGESTKTLSVNFFKKYQHILNLKLTNPNDLQNIMINKRNVEARSNEGIKKLRENFKKVNPVYQELEKELGSFKDEGNIEEKKEIFKKYSKNLNKNELNFLFDLINNKLIMGE